ncbi:hypothetical protein BDW02DRAFT_525822 [Decorospora gaudefroyi]|uniref:DUF866-domain-containing protein n=1 Tax=Decorospora gaudefroyi TaxID=184978 RepID=A0A6A5KFB6_9PLEO|nr:hypothetical protein BDW02DRAFT_525822 [Decorospora gaudefroyi]
MVLALALKAELNGVTDLRPRDTEDSPFFYTFTVQCTSCRETHANPISFTRFESNEQSGSKGEANFVWRCKNCKVSSAPPPSPFLPPCRLFLCVCREHSANVRAPPVAYPQSDPPKKMNILEFDCRGLEFVEFRAEGEFLATGVESGTKFEGIELPDGEWYDYDEKAGEEVSITGVEWEIRRA